MAGAMFSHGESRTSKRQGRGAGALSTVLHTLGARALASRLKRRLGWFTSNLTARKLTNIVLAGTECVLKREKLRAWPVFLRIDISPLCNLNCTICIHADANGNPALEKQEFHGRQRMTVDQFSQIVNEVKDRSTGISLYYLGDPLAHPDLDEICRIGRQAGLNVHYSTNFSFVLTDERIQRIVTSGLTHLTVCVDGLSQERYQLTRVGGRIQLVLFNLMRLCRYRRALRQSDPLIEVQYIRYQHNLDELDEARRVFSELGVDQVHELWGGLHNYTDRDPGNYTVFGPKKKGRLSRCHWPYFFMQVKYNGDVLPCCCFRLGQQYTGVDDPRCAGNVFDTGVQQVWNSIRYQQSRRLASNPQAVESDPSLKANFCYACPRLFHTDFAEQTCRFGEDFCFEELYAIGANGRPARRRAGQVLTTTTG